MAEVPDKPSLTLSKGTITLEDLVKLFKHLTGREPSAEDLEQARAILEKRKDGDSPKTP